MPWRTAKPDVFSANDICCEVSTGTNSVMNDVRGRMKISVGKSGEKNGFNSNGLASGPDAYGR